jgi:uncharacterized protein (TIGR03083 family)
VTENDLQPLVASECRRLHDALSALAEPVWNRDSLCEGWSIRHVIAHLTMPARYTREQYGTELAAAGYDFATLSNRIAARDASLPREQLLADLTSDTLAQWATPDGGVIGSLGHVVIHGLDVTVPTGLGCVASDDAVRAVLDNLTSQGVHRHFGSSIDGRRLEADNIAWTYGTGETVAAPAHLLILALTGRAGPGLLDFGTN